jgi:hypothetical protein
VSRDQYPTPDELAKRKLREGRPASELIKERAALNSPQVVRLAERLGKTPQEILDEIPEDTLRRLKQPLRESVDEEGNRVFDDAIMVTEGIRSQFAGDKGKTHPEPQGDPIPERDEKGKFS